MTEMPANAGTDPLRVEVYSDVVCPWCYIGKRRLEAALQLPGAPLVAVRWRPFQLDPGAPSPGGPVAQAYAKKFGGPERASAIIAQVTEAAAAEGLEFRLDRAVRSNTFDAHRLLWWVATTTDLAAVPKPQLDASGRLSDPQSALKESLLAAYFTGGLDVSDHRVLVGCAERSGLDPTLAGEALAAGAGTDEVRAEIAVATAADVTAVPTFVLDGRLALPGAQEPAAIARYLGRIAATR
jgi:predicted DsbA family dithiol-disulfide isomerase